VLKKLNYRGNNTSNIHESTVSWSCEFMVPADDEKVIEELLK
jgi:hypothetical protein